MSISSRFRTYGLYSASGRDSLGALTAGAYVKDIVVSISLLTGSIYSNSNNLIVAESSHSGILYNDSTVFEKGMILKDGSVTYQITFANYATDSMTVLYLKQVV